MGAATVNDVIELPDEAAPVLTDDQIEDLHEFGEERDVEQGEFLYRVGDREYAFIVILDGTIEVVREGVDGRQEEVIVVHADHRFLGELNLLTGQRVYLSARAGSPGRILEIPPAEFRRLMGEKPELADIIFRALVARRELLRQGPGADTVRIIGSRFSPEALALRAFANRARVPHSWIDLEDEKDVDVLLASMGLRPRDTPVVVTPFAILRHPTPGEFADRLGLAFHAPPGYTFDLVVIGTGPAGLAAAVYGASEGLDTISLDASGAGGQAGASSRIENYVGFPNGISGEELAAKAAIQAQRLGARLNAPCEVVGLRSENGFHVVELADGSEVPTRAVILASGARYQRLAVKDLEQFEGAGVYYAATDLEVRTCNRQPVVVVGGGNSAGQAAIYLAQQGSKVIIAIRGDDLSKRMSRYLVQRIEAAYPDIEVRTCTQVVGLEGEGHLERVVLEHALSHFRETVSCLGLFCFIGADPATAWLDNTVILDDRGFVLTDRSLPSDVVDESFEDRPPLPFETSVPGVFAVGDVRNGSLKRVAAAVGEGSSAVRSVHELLNTTVG